MTAKTVRVGVIGTGIGVEHIRSFQQAPGATITAICSAQQERAEATAREFAVPRDKLLLFDKDTQERVRS